MRRFCHRPRTTCQHRHRAGYGLVVIAALFTAFALVAAAAIERNGALDEIAQQQQARAQLTKLSVALARFARYNNNRFPCPASERLAVTAMNFGAPDSATCFSGQTINTTNTPLVSGTTPADKLIRGVVPVRSLAAYGITQEDAFDPWGARITYIVHRDLTFGQTTIPAINATTERPEVRDYITGEVITGYPDMILMSFGRDRVGGRLRNQASLAAPAIACTTGTTDRRFENCDNDNQFLIGPVNIIQSTGSASEYFDDLVSAYTYGAP